MYKKVLTECSTVKVDIFMMRSLKLMMYQVQQTRIALTPLCDSRFLLADGSFSSLPFGHKDIRTSLHQTIVEELSDSTLI